MTGSLSLRPARAGDCSILFDWRNDPDTRAASLDDAILDPDKHHDWYNQTLDNPNRRIFIGSFGQTEIGMVRLDHIPEDDRVEVSIIISPDARGAGFGEPLLRGGLEQNPYRADHFSATIKPTNIASQKIFAACDFRLWRDNFLIRGERSI
jgi:RimJ/RimL family protein N-acetyltransferase